MIFLISDTHWSHHNIIKYCGRPTNHQQMMWDGLQIVGPEDTLIHCGDVAFARKHTRSRAREVFNNLPGAKKILIRGNHDNKIIYRLPWDEVYKGSYVFTHQGLMIHIQHFSYTKAENIGPGVRRALRFFFQDRCNKTLALPNADICIHGHIHNLGQRYLWADHKLVVNVCVEHWDYKPANLDDIVREYHWRKRDWDNKSDPRKGKSR